MNRRAWIGRYRVEAGDEMGRKGEMPDPMSRRLAICLIAHGKTNAKRTSITILRVFLHGLALCELCASVPLWILVRQRGTRTATLGMTMLSRQSKPYGGDLR